MGQCQVRRDGVTGQLLLSCRQWRWTQWTLSEATEAAAAMQCLCEQTHWAAALGVFQLSAPCKKDTHGGGRFSKMIFFVWPTRVASASPSWWIGLIAWLGAFSKGFFVWPTRVALAGGLDWWVGA